MSMMRYTCTVNNAKYAIVIMILLVWVYTYLPEYMSERWQVNFLELAKTPKCY